MCVKQQYHPIPPSIAPATSATNASGTEPKLKTYISVSAKSREDAEVIEKKIADELGGFFA